MPVNDVSALHDDRLTPYRDLKRTNLTRWSGRFIAEGWLVVERLLRSEYPIDSVLVSQRRQAEIVPRIAGLRADVDVLVIPQDLAESLVGYNFHAGVLACARRKPATTGVLDVLAAQDRATLVICDRIAGPENLGTIIRLSAAFGVTGIVLGPGTADPLSRRVLRVSMGGALHLPIVESDDLHRDLLALRERWRFELAATVVSDPAEPLPAATRGPRLALLLGNEAEGIDPALLALCDRRVTIPVTATSDSINVACAAAIFLHHFTRGG